MTDIPDTPEAMQRFWELQDMQIEVAEHGFRAGYEVGIKSMKIAAMKNLLSLELPEQALPAMHASLDTWEQVAMTDLDNITKQVMRGLRRE
jgi:hypothetical protein